MSEIFVDIKNAPFQEKAAFNDLMVGNALQLGNGSKVFRADQSGIWLGAEKFADAPFSVDMDGNLVATSADFSGTGYTKTVTFAQASIPTSVAVGDLWVDTDDNNKMYRAASVGADQITAGEWEVVDQDAYKLDKVGGTYVTTTTAAAAKVQILPDANTGIVAYASNGTSVVFKVEVGGTNVGDVTLGDYAGGNGVLWDQSAGDLIIKGDMKAGSIDGVTITGVTITGSTFKTGTTGTRVEIDSTNDDIRLYDSGNDEVFRLNDSGGYITYEAKDSRNMNFVSSGGLIYFDDRIIITDSGGVEMTGERSSALSYDWGFAPYVNGGNYGWVSEMQGGTWNFAMNAGTP